MTTPRNYAIEALRPFMRHLVWCNCKTDDPPDTERCKCGLRAAFAALDVEAEGLLTAREWRSLSYDEKMLILESRR